MPRQIELKDLIAAGVHFGHQTSRWSPKMEPYIWGHKNKVHLINVAWTLQQLQKSAEFLKNIAAEGKTVLFVGTKKPAQKAIIENAQATGCPSVTHRWIGGTLTNFSQVKKSRTKLLHFKDVLAKSEQFSYTKKELNRLQKAVNRLQANIGGIVSLSWPVGALVVVDVRKEHSAVKEAVSMGIPVVGLVDTNSDPSLIDYVIPANDDSAKSIELLLSYLAEYVKEGKELASQRIATQQAGQSAQEATDGSAVAVVAIEDETEEESLAREQARARKLRETIKAKKGDTRSPMRRGPARRPAK